MYNLDRKYECFICAKIILNLLWNLSSKLYLSVQLNQTGVRCSVNGTLINHISYADDMVLIAPSISAMRKLLAVCENYAEEHNMLYNTTKS